jgi:hypothetical protein
MLWLKVRSERSKVLMKDLKLINFYMIYGGTNWGHLAFPRKCIPGLLVMISGAITTYDYWAPIQEDRSLNEPKYSELKVSYYLPFESQCLHH